MGISDPAPFTRLESCIMNHIRVIQRFVEVHQLMYIEFSDFSQSVTTGTSALRVIERKSIGIADMGLTDPREQQTEEGINIGVSTNRRPRISSRFFLIDYDRDRKIFHAVYFRAAIFGQKLLHKTWKCYIQFPSRFCRNRIQTKRRLSRTGYSGKNCDLFLGNF